jgi:epoxyqueuosine reductase
MEACGIIEATSFEEFLTELDRRSELFPLSGPFYDRLRRLANPKESIDWAKSIIVCLWRYDRYQNPDGLERYIAKCYLFDGRLKYSKAYAGNVAFTRFLQELGFREALPC